MIYVFWFQFSKQRIKTAWNQTPLVTGQGYIYYYISQGILLLFFFLIGQRRRRSSRHRFNTPDDNSSDTAASHFLFDSASQIADVVSTINVSTPFRCSTCFKMFSCQSHLIIHERRHTGARPFVCKVCGKSFTQSNNLYRHMRVFGHVE